MGRFFVLIGACILFSFGHWFLGIVAMLYVLL
jgi:hypothetical protein